MKQTLIFFYFLLPVTLFAQINISVDKVAIPEVWRYLSTISTDNVTDTTTYHTQDVSVTKYYIRVTMTNTSNEDVWFIYGNPNNYSNIIFCFYSGTDFLVRGEYIYETNEMKKDNTINHYMLKKSETKTFDFDIVEIKRSLTHDKATHLKADCFIYVRGSSTGNSYTTKKHFECDYPDIQPNYGLPGNASRIE